MSETAQSAPTYFPVYLDLRGKRCLVVGGGQVARRKVDALVHSGAQVTVVSPASVPMPDGVCVVPRPFQTDDLAGAMLVIAATNDPAVNVAVFREAESRGIWVNVVDDPPNCSMIFPAVVRRGALCIAISTGGASPTLARQLREQLETEFGPEYGELIELLAALRRKWEPRAIAAKLPDAVRRQAWDDVLALPLLNWLRMNDRAAAEAAATEVLEEAFVGNA